MDMRAAQRLHDRIRHLDDAEWEEMLAASLDGESPDGVELPAWPTLDDIRTSLYPRVPDRAALRQGTIFTAHLKRLAAAHGAGLPETSRVLDAGCGWGRVYRLLLKDVAPDHLFGVDVDGELIAACRACLPPEQFAVAPRSGSLPYPPGSFDIVFANSVLSHLQAEEHAATVEAWAQVLAPGGLLVATIIAEERIETNAVQAEEGTIKPPFHNIEDFAALRREFDANGIAWVSTQRRGEQAGYGLAFVGESWMRANWPGTLDIVACERVDNYNQSLVVARKAASP